MPCESPQEYWDYVLTHKGRVSLLATLGRAYGYQYLQWDELPKDLQDSIKVEYEKP